MRVISSSANASLAGSRSSGAYTEKRRRPPGKSGRGGMETACTRDMAGSRYQGAPRGERGERATPRGVRKATPQLSPWIARVVGTG